jgi:hypothetical protein
MSARQNMKITTNGKDFKKINNPPENYNDLVLIAIEKLGGNIKDNIQISFIDINTKKEITNQKEYDELRNKGIPIKLQVCLKERQQENINDINNINEVVAHNDKVQEQPAQMQMSLEEDYKNKLKESLISIITSKMQTMQTDLINELTANVTNIMPSNISLHQQQQHNNMSLSENIIHKGITCSNCKATDIKGIRYKCTSCSNYNLCETCEALNTHDIYHIFIKIRIPTPEHELLPQLTDLTYNIP